MAVTTHIYNVHLIWGEFLCVLVLAGTELIFLPVAGVVLWFGFSTRIILIIHWWF